jgi:hypothetical protein
MSAGYSTTSDNNRSGQPRPKARHALAFRAGEDALTGTRHGVTLLLYFKYLVARCGLDTSSLISQFELAAAIGVSVRTIRRYDDSLIAAGLIWRVKDGHSYRRYIVAYEPEPAEHSAAAAECSAPPEVVIIGPEPSIFAPRTGQIDPVEPDRSIPLYPLTGSKVNQDIGLRPGGDIHPETIELLTAEKVHPATIRALGHLDPVYVREQIDAAWRSGRGREMPNFLIGCLKTGGVYGASGTGRSRGPKAPPARPAPTQPEPPMPPLPSFCPRCYGLCPADWHGHCPRCERELFDPLGGDT